ncbi:hypothetical protein EJ04DRAFT_551446 [Polyplosphaeria fusca]|uniref:Zn(2)-C6 fungal-type domain-containing protein n=1 Tax=Polyplosphaeria fusca TaxID=682080 RepID=A0A9P4V328_9PLEO|nr:hypothetical protein EJ04DRAFT_551446 [Polyplosphaeria fusca]
MATPAATPTQASHLDLDALIASLPACKRCRDCRRGCDTLLPKCRQCTKAGVECMFYDHGRNTLLPRTYIAQLVDEVRRLSASHLPSPAETASTLQATPSAVKTPSTAKAESVASDQNHFDHHFAYAGGSYRYLGADSCLVKSPRLQPAGVSSPDMDEEDWAAVNSEPALGTFELVELYLDAVQPMYPILDLSLRFLQPELPSDLTPPEIFSLNMIYTIACHFYPGTNANYLPSGKLSFHHARFCRYRLYGQQFFDEATKYLEASTVETTIATLRAVLLLAVNSLFDPKSGNIGQQVALAARLALNLEKQDLSPEDTTLLRNMQATIFSIENEIASTLDRPATFPEPDWELCFDPEKPCDYLCSLYRLQHRFRKGDKSFSSLPLLDDKGCLKPGLRMALHQTHLLINPCWGTAWYVLEAVVSQGSIHTFLTPHWVYRAGTVLIQGLPSLFEGNLLQLYSNALVVLNLSNGKWRSSASLAASLGDLLKQMKIQCQPEWDPRYTTIGDVSM